jgi:acetyl-CoA carboxylase, biotin carboxylase subunit
VRVLIANRGEIAVRIIRACREMGLSTVAVYSDCDRDARHVRDADLAVRIGANDARFSYLNIDAILSAARATNADAVHPGYGFLAENAAFAAACAAAGLTFIGPSADAIALMGSKTEARTAATTAGVPVVPGTEAPLPAGADAGELARAAAAVGFPLMVKAVAGGGGKGMRVVESASGLLTAVQTARSEAGSAFGDTAVYLERRLTRPRHIEIQLLGDHHGTIVPFVERECSIQRRHQKVIEESPSLAVTQPLRERMAAAATAVAKSVGYTNAGTIEFLLDEDGSFYFLEMNTRLQVEHPVTEMVTDVDLVQWQIRIARGERLDLDPMRALTPNGHAIECRIYAEDPDQGFMPSPGLIRGLRAATGPGVRDDGGVVAGYTVPVFYDSMIAKLIVWAPDRGEAVARMARALAEYQVLGIRTTVPFFLWLLQQPEYLDGRYDTTYLDRVLAERRGESFSSFSTDEIETIAIAAALDTVLRASADDADGRATRSRRGWTQLARIEALRG